MILPKIFKSLTFDLGISYKEYTQRQKKNKFLKFENEDAENEYYNNVEKIEKSYR